MSENMTTEVFNIDNISTDNLIKLQYSISSITQKKSECYEYVLIKPINYKISQNMLMTDKHFYYELEDIFIKKFLSFYKDIIYDYLTDLGIVFDLKFINFIKLILKNNRYNIRIIDVPLGYRPIFHFINSNNEQTISCECIISDKKFNPYLDSNNKMIEKFVNRINSITWLAIKQYYKSIKMYWDLYVKEEPQLIMDANEYANFYNSIDITFNENKEHYSKAFERIIKANNSCKKLTDIIMSIDDYIFDEMVRIHGNDKKTLIYALIDIDEIKDIIKK